MPKTTIIAVVIVLAILVLGYLLYQSGAPEEQEQLEQEETTEPVVHAMEVIQGQDFEVILEANPTTGYNWQLEFDSQYIELVSRDYQVSTSAVEEEIGTTTEEESAAEEPMVGVGGKETFVFKPLQTGQTAITFSYLREWEIGVEPIQIEIYQLTIVESEQESGETAE